VYSCDVGQGDATVINLHHNSAIVIDVGPDPLLIDQCLRTLHIKRIALLILTHPHADHVAGLSGAQKNRTIDATWYGNIAAGSRARVGEYTIDVLWPQRAGFDDPNPNNVSIAALISSPDLTLFAAGDIEPPVQEQLRGKVGKVDIYKVAHHGSRFQDPVLMREISPTIALISAGEGNSYGHPAASTIAELEGLHAKVLRTDIHGAIAASADHHRISFEYQKARPRLIGFG
jgi:competence protein ComEC